MWSPGIAWSVLRGSHRRQVEFEDSIIEDLELLGIKGDATSHTSDHFDELYRLVMQLIKQGDAYADDTLQEEVRRRCVRPQTL